MARVSEVDVLRGVAIVLMIIYHFFFDLAYLRLADIPIFDIEWQMFQRLVGAMFVFTAGISLTLSESRNKESYWHHFKRALRLGAVAVLITAATWIYPHNGFIMFGIIHFIAAATLIAPFFLRFKHWNLIIGLAIVLAGFYVGTMRTDLPYLFWLGIIYPGYRPLDHYSLIPWFGIMLIGTYVGQRLFPKGENKTGINARSGIVEFLGRNSLVIYLTHQLVLFGSMIAYLMLV